MEEYDDLSDGPDQNGKLNLSYNEWEVMPSELHKKYRNKLVALSLSHNRLVEVSNHVGKLTLMRELDLSHNRLERIDSAIGSLIRLRTLNLTNNQLTKLPNELRECQMMVRCLFLFEAAKSNNDVYTNHVYNS